MADEASNQPKALLSATLLGELVSGLLLEIDLDTGRVGDPGQRLGALLGLRAGQPLPSARGLLRLLETPKILLGALRATHLMPGQSQQVVLKFQTAPEHLRHARVRVRLSGSRQLLLYLEEFTEQREQDITRAVMAAGLEHGTNEYYVLDRRLRLITANGAAFRNTGYTPEEMIGKPASIVAPELNDPGYQAAQAEQLRRNRTASGSYVHRRKDGTEYLFEHSTTEVRLFGQHWYVAIGQDVTESIKQQVALRESEERLATAIRSGRVAICDYRVNMDQLYVSDTAWDWLGEGPKTDLQNVHRWLIDRLHPEDRSAVIARVIAAGERVELVNLDFRIRHAGGPYLSWHFQGRVTAAGGLLQRISGTLADVTEQRRAETARDRAAKNLRALLESVDEAILSLDGHGRILDWNPAAQALLRGVLQAGDPIFSLFEDAIELRQAARGDPIHTRLKTARDASRGHVELRFNPIDLDPEPGYTLVILDTSARVLREQALRAAAADAAAAARAKSEFLATMSHEIRTPMNGVLGMAQVLMDTTLDAEQQQALDIMVRSGTALLNVINDVLDFSRLEAGKLAIRLEPFEPREIAADVHELLSHQAQEKGIELELVAPEHCGSYLGDASRVRQILINLVGNAIKFTDDGSVTTRLTTTPQGIELTVSDTGIGIAAEDLPKLFDAFSQADSSSTRRHGGSGLGLAISHRLAGQMNGTIEVSSRPGAGSEFRCLLGLAPAAASARPDNRSGTASIAAGFGDARVLVVEDNPINQKVASRLLERLGCDVTLAANGAEAVDLWRRDTFDLIFMDCQMPVMDGFAATRLIRELEQSNARTTTPIVAMTANVLEADRQACLSAGMNDHAPKPIVRTLLAEKLHRWLPAASE
ncbi:MAG: ATP-binding protein [Pseudomonadota bacterium]